MTHENSLFYDIFENQIKENDIKVKNRETIYITGIKCVGKLLELYCLT